MKSLFGQNLMLSNIVCVWDIKKGVDITQDFQKEQDCLKIKKTYEARAKLEGYVDEFNAGGFKKLNNITAGEETENKSDC